MKNRPEAIILDLGGVILNLDYFNTRNAFVELGLQDFDRLFTQSAQAGYFDAFDRGELTPDGFRSYLKGELPEGTGDRQIDEAWNAMLLDFPSERIQFIRRLSASYRLFLLSNTNEIHVRAFRRILSQNPQLVKFEEIFEACYFSCEIGMRKPDQEIFEWVISKNNLSKESTLFIDDSIQHVEGARKAGLHAEWLKVAEGESLEERFKYLLDSELL